ncbi:MAG: PRC-barrel domain-containing protein [Prolixibacteraceae bacterium]|nr:PRC-barrel domain-containing protein [Prolixibacteraceae bacterium]
MSDNNQDLFPLDELTNYKVADDYSDVRGWDVFDAQNRIVGKVEHLLVSKTAERVVYLDVEVDRSLLEAGYNTFQDKVSKGVHGFINKEGDDHLIVPIGMVSLDTVNKKILTSQIDYNTFTKARRFKIYSIIDREYELMLLRLLIGDNAIDSTILDDRFYNRKEYEKYFHNTEVFKNNTNNNH